MVIYVVNKCPVFYGTQRFIHILQDPTTGPCPETVESIPTLTIFLSDPL